MKKRMEKQVKNSQAGCFLLTLSFFVWKRHDRQNMKILL
ncbi:hypothetical protein V529_07700 [Bacillus velezensis SQR9]|nr:hypothetical protein V529_07700 [Bacillus velezensis SQR9]